ERRDDEEAAIDTRPMSRTFSAGERIVRPAAPDLDGSKAGLRAIEPGDGGGDERELEPGVEAGLAGDPDDDRVAGTPHRRDVRFFQAGVHLQDPEDTGVGR